MRGILTLFSLSAFLGVPNLVHALGTSMGPYGMGAASLGAGGAVVSEATGGEAVFWNPALLSGAASIGVYEGVGGPAQSTEEALVLEGSLDESVRAAFWLQDQEFPQVGSYHEGVGALAVAVNLGSWVTAGTAQKLLIADPGGGEGWAMDLGAAAAFSLGGTWRLRLGLADANALSDLTWSDGLTETQAAELRGGASLEFSPGTWIACEEDSLEGVGAENAQQWRLGGQKAFLGGDLSLRVGAAGSDLGSTYYSAGLGGRLPWWDRSLEADYAALVPSSGQAPNAARHVFSLSWTFGAPQEKDNLGGVAAGMGRELTDASGRLRWAHIDMAVDASAGPVRTWSLEIEDTAGRPLKVFSGTGALPPGIDWDGQDTLGRFAAVNGLRYVLKARTSAGVSLRKAALLVPTAETALADVPGMDQGFAMRKTSSSGGLARAKLVLKGGTELEVSEADFDLRSAASDQGVTSWELRIVDASGKVLRTMGGKGRPPKAVHWEGNTDLGLPAQGTLGASFELRVNGPAGSRRIAEAPVVTQDGFGRLVRAAEIAVVPMVQAPPPKQAGRKPPVPEAEFRASARGLNCVFYFEKHRAELTESDFAVAKVAAIWARKHEARGARVDGFADHEGGLATETHLSQDRADAVLKALLDQGADLDGVEARGLAEGSPTGEGRPTHQRSRNRRVELWLEAGAR
jgi:outer membrane protein OmpA-like peptidoglycan-associated protein